MSYTNGRNPIYREVQKVQQIWVWLIILFLAGLVWYGFIEQILMGRPFGTRPAPDIVVIIFWVIFGIGVPLILPLTKLITEVRDDGVYVQLFPFHWSFRRISFKEIKSYEVRTYRPIREYGGWGIRKGPQGMAYNMSGNKGVQIDFITGKRLLIGSQQPDELYRLIQVQINK